jgi:hypothetical protein
MFKKFLLAAGFFVFLNSSSFAEERFYFLNPIKWTLYDGNIGRGLPLILSPDGAEVLPFTSIGTQRGKVGPRSDLLYVIPGGIAKFYILYQYLSGTSPPNAQNHHAAHFCWDGHSIGYLVDQCLNIDGLTGTVNSVDPGILNFNVVAVRGYHNLYYVEITAQTPASIPAGTQAFPYVAALDQHFVLFSGAFITR